jgi:hypothetical protein
MRDQPGLQSETLSQNTKMDKQANIHTNKKIIWIMLYMLEV